MMIIKCDNVTDNKEYNIKLHNMCLGRTDIKNTFTHKKETIIKRKFNTPQEMQEKMEHYFSVTPIDELTLTGLVLALETNKTTLANYQQKPEYEDIIAHAKLVIEHSYELSLRKRGRTSDIFALKNFGWSDRQEVQYDGVKPETKLDLLIQQLSKGDDEN
jgi:hypothetical protein